MKYLAVTITNCTNINSRDTRTHIFKYSDTIGLKPCLLDELLHLFTWLDHVGLHSSSLLQGSKW